MKSQWLVLAILIGIFFGTGAVYFPLNESFWFVGLISTVFFALPAFYFFARDVGVRKGLLWIIGLSLFAWGLEAFAVWTGFPYGGFAYSNLVGPKIVGLVPLQVPFAWLPLVFGSVIVWENTNKSYVTKALLSALTLVAIDLVLDPGAVSMGVWEYKNPSMYYGVAFSNFFGWFLSGFFVSWVLHKYLTLHSKAILISTWLILSFWTSVCFAIGLGIPGLIGLLLATAFYIRAKP